MDNNKIVDIARTLKTWCSDRRNCDNCPFGDGWNCTIGIPADWISRDWRNTEYQEED